MIWDYLGCSQVIIRVEWARPCLYDLIHIALSLSLSIIYIYIHMYIYICTFISCYIYIYIYIYNIYIYTWYTHTHTSGEGRPDISRIFRDLLGGPTEPDARRWWRWCFPPWFTTFDYWKYGIYWEYEWYYDMVWYGMINIYIYSMLLEDHQLTLVNGLKCFQYEGW